jgi:hypothetical protein
MDNRQTTAMAMCQMFLKQKLSEKGTPLDGADIAAAVVQVIPMLGDLDIDRQGLIKALEERFTVYAPDHLTLGADDNHVAWLPAKRNSILWRYWHRYKIHLEEKLPPAGVTSVERVTDDLLQRLEDPQRSGMWDRRGLVMGHVQSGKTANYCGLICKAADAGYKVIIVLSGMHNSLRSQTQIRLDEGFLGFMSEPIVTGQQAFRRVGVGLIDAGTIANTATNRTEKGDFNKTVANQFGIHPGGLPLLFVTKKLVSVLQHLNRWIGSCTNAEDPRDMRRFVRDVPLLVVDDEADLASVDTKSQPLDANGNPDLDYDPTRTNEQIRLLLRSFEKSAYVGYTATPFANIFIHDRGRTNKLGDDLFPRSFIVSIPPPSNYIGPARVFGLREDEESGLEEVRPLPIARIVTDHAASQAVDETEGWMPPRLVNRTDHNPKYEGQARVPPSLRAAIHSFILATTVRTIRGCKPLHNTMLIHVVRLTKIQKHVAQQVEHELTDIVQRLRNGDGSRRPTIIDELHNLWTNDFVPTTRDCLTILEDDSQTPVWADIESRLLSITSSIRVKIVNGSAGDVLDYEEQKQTGMNVIAVGGDKLSRGLTLEGLTVSYFLRASRMYDTLMQMGRWFGYREHYADLCRLYTTGELIEWFTHITTASEELRREFEHMVAVGGTPKDYGLKVRSHPTLLVTSAVKMRTGTKLKLSFSGSISETIIFRRDQVWLKSNVKAMENWLDALGAPSDGNQGAGYNWREIESSKVLDFLSSYSTHLNALRANTGLLSHYIRVQNGIDELTQWTVRLCAGEGAETPFGAGNLLARLVTRQPFPEAQGLDRYTIRRLVNPTDESVDLDTCDVRAAMELTIKNWKVSNDPKKANREPKRPGGPEIREVRAKSNGLMLLYPLDPAMAGMPKGSPVIVGMAVSFPSSATAREITYIVDNVFMRQGGDDDSL